MLVESDGEIKDLAPSELDLWRQQLEQSRNMPVAGAHCTARWPMRARRPPLMVMVMKGTRLVVTAGRSVRTARHCGARDSLYIICRRPIADDRPSFAFLSRHISLQAPDTRTVTWCAQHKQPTITSPWIAGLVACAHMLTRPLLTGRVDRRNEFLPADL